MSEFWEIQAPGIHAMGFHQFGGAQGSRGAGEGGWQKSFEGHELMPDNSGSRLRRILSLASLYLRERPQAMPAEAVHSVFSDQHCQPFIPELILVFNPLYGLDTLTREDSESRGKLPE